MFNPQQDGASALWVRVRGIPPGDRVLLDFGGVWLKAHVGDGLVTAAIPIELLEHPRDLELRLASLSTMEEIGPLSFAIEGEAIPSPEAEVLPAPPLSVPNFFIVGAPRCGTTSLHAYLADHPQCFMSHLKEPFFFDPRSHGAQEAISDLDAYLALFQRLPWKVRAVGEASPTYLSSREAMQAIFDFNPEARIVVMLRNPVDAAFSLHQRMFEGGRNEDIADFATAWEKQEERAGGRSLPTALVKDGRTFFVQYKKLFMLGHQLQALLGVFPRDQVHFILFDDLKTDTRGTYAEVLEFLGLDKDTRQGFPLHNKTMHRQRMDRGLRERLIHEFSEDVDLLASLTHKNLDHWKTPVD